MHMYFSINILYILEVHCTLELGFHMYMYIMHILCICTNILMTQVKIKEQTFVWSIEPGPGG